MAGAVPLKGEVAKIAESTGFRPTTFIVVEFGTPTEV
jgi:hypothetical protein